MLADPRAARAGNLAPAALLGAAMARSRCRPGAVPTPSGVRDMGRCAFLKAILGLVCGCGMTSFCVLLALTLVDSNAAIPAVRSEPMN